MLLARNEPGQRVCYPFLFERRPGELWVSTMQGYLRVRVGEQDLRVASADHPESR